MPRAVLLQCPVCAAVRVLEGGTAVDDVHRVARSHLETHALSEPRRAIGTHHVAADALELLVSATDRDRLPTAAWCDPGATWLPDQIDVDAGRSVRVAAMEPTADEHR